MRAVTDGLPRSHIQLGKLKQLKQRDHYNKPISNSNLSSMSTIKTVALAGASGNLGPAVLDQLLKANFTVTVLARADSKSAFPASVQVARVDYDSSESLTKALQGQDALVSTLASLAVSRQKRMIDAAVVAGVKRILPSEFGSDTLNPKTRGFPVYKDKVEMQEYLVKLAEEGKVTYTLILNSAFFDWALKVGFLLGESYDGGERPFSTTTLATIGKAVAASLKKAEETENKAVYVHDAVVTQKQVGAMVEKATGKKWEAQDYSTAQIEKEAYAELGKEKPDYRSAMFGFLKNAMFREGYGGEFKTTDNELLGIKMMDEKEIEAVVTENVSKGGHPGH